MAGLDILLNQSTCCLLLRRGSDFGFPTGGATLTSNKALWWTVSVIQTGSLVCGWKINMEDAAEHGMVRKELKGDCDLL